MDSDMGKAEEASVGFSGLLEWGSATGPDRPRTGAVIEPSVWLVAALGEMGERLGDLEGPTSGANDF